MAPTHAIVLGSSSGNLCLSARKTIPEEEKAFVWKMLTMKLAPHITKTLQCMTRKYYKCLIRIGPLVHKV